MGDDLKQFIAEEGNYTTTTEKVPETSAQEASEPVASKMTSERIAEANEILRKYQDGKRSLENRIVSNEQWWKLQSWSEITENESDKQNRPHPTSAYLFNSIANKHADAMDNYPEPNILPREEADEEGAKQLSEILPTLLEYNDYESVYSEGWWYKLKAGSVCQGVFWDTTKENGLGDVSIKVVDLLNLFWQPGINDIQDSRNVFSVALVDNDLIAQQYPQTKGKLGNASLTVARYKMDDHADTSDKSYVVDWYYKTKTDSGKTILNYCKYVDNIVLYASEDDPVYAEEGYYQHGKYPFVIDTLFPIADSPCGFGYIDVMKSPQMYIDKLNQVLLEHSVYLTRKRYFVKQGGNVNEEEFSDWTKTFVHVAGNLNDDNLREIKIDPLDGSVLNALINKIDELKETSGNRDFSQGSTQSGVTAASAIAALQEAGSKLSRDMIKSSYNAFTEVCYLVIELIRQFYDEPRSFRIIGETGQAEYRQFSNSAIGMQSQDLGIADEFGQPITSERMPVFDIKCSASKKSPFSRAAQNELAKELYGAGIFNPQLADQALAMLEMMDFEGKDKIVQRIQDNGTMLQQMQMMQQQIMQLQAMLGMPIQQGGEPLAQGMPQGGDMQMVDTSGYGISGMVENASMDKARQRAQSVAGVR